MNEIGNCCEVKLEMASSMKFYQDLLQQYGIDNSTFAVAASILVVLLSLVFWKLFVGGKKRKSTIVMLGVTDSGKSSLFAQLICGKEKYTQTSLKENQSQYLLGEDKNKTSLSIVDIPGQESIRSRFFDKYKDSALGILYVVDSETFQKNLKDVAEFLFQILTDKTVHKAHPFLCIACNKQDLLLAKSKRVIQNQLEKELNTVRKTQSAALTSTSGGESDNVFLGEKDKEFQFQHLPKFKIQFVECNAKSGTESKVNLNEVVEWMSTLV